MAGLTNTGFVPKRLNEIITGLRENAKPIFQDLVKPGEEVDTSDTSTIGRLIGLISLDLDQLWQAAQEVYQAFDTNSATGVALDNIVQYLGLSRKRGAPTVIRASVWGITNTFLPEGQFIKGDSSFQFSSTTPLNFLTSDIIGAGVEPTVLVTGQDSGFTFITDEGIFNVNRVIVDGDTTEIVLQDWLTQMGTFNLLGTSFEVSDGKFYVEVEDYFSYITITSTTGAIISEVKKRLTFNSVDNGDISAPLNSVTNILTPIYGWLSVNNEVSAERGSIEETDEQLRQRFRTSKAARAANMADALYAQLLELRDVEFARVYENRTESTGAQGQPPHSFMAIVRGGVSTDVADIVWKNTPLGIASHGNETVIIRDSQNFEREVKFSRAVDVPIYVNVEVQKTDSTFPENGLEQIRNAVVDYINERATFGESVIYTRMFTPVNSVPGHQINLLQIGRSALTMGESNIPMSWEEFPISGPEFVTVQFS